MGTYASCSRQLARWHRHEHNQRIRGEAYSCPRGIWSRLQGKGGSGSRVDSAHEARTCFRRTSRPQGGMDCAFRYMESDWRAPRNTVGYRSTAEIKATNWWSAVFDERYAHEDEAVRGIRICPGRTAWTVEVEYDCVWPQVGGTKR